MGRSWIAIDSLGFTVSVNRSEDIQMSPVGSATPLETARTRLAAIWLIGAGAIASLVFAQTIFGALGSSTQEVWEWLLPAIMPTLGTIVSTLAATALMPSAPRSEVSRSFLLTAEILSLFYLFLILLLILLKVKISADTAGWLSTLHQANLLLGPMQGLIATTLGVVFLSRKQKPNGH